jgi:hypothetical protein
MAFYILVSIGALFGVWRLSRSRVMRAWLSGHSSDPSRSAVDRVEEATRGATYRDDG